MSIEGAVEIERKYAVPDGVALPGLGAVPGVLSAEAAPVVQLEAVYLDTEDEALLRARIALRRRTGGHDDGWHVKLPAAEGRLELHAPIDPADPDALPAELGRLLLSRLRGRTPSPIARIRTERRAVVVTDVDGGAVEVVDDAVTATDVRGGVLRSWREWEAEQTGEPKASAALLGRIDRALRATGATVSPSPAKLAQALGRGTPGRAPQPATAGEALVAMVAPLAEQLHGGVAELVQRGDPDGEVVHELRKTLRRLRALLALAPVAGPSGRAVRDRLQALGEPLGAARDPIVAAGVAEALLERVAESAPGRAAARQRLVDAPRAGLAAATADLVDHLLAQGAAEAYAALDRFVREGPDGEDAGAPPKRLVTIGERTVRRAVRRTRRAGGDLDRLHAERKAARRARFVVEFLVDAGLVRRGSRLDRAGRAAQRVQDALGDHRDLALFRAALVEAAAAAGSDAFALGALDAHAERRLGRLLRRAHRRVRAFVRRA